MHDLTEEEIDLFYNQAWRRFYYRPSNIIEIISWLLRNPGKLKFIINYFNMLQKVVPHKKV